MAFPIDYLIGIFCLKEASSYNKPPSKTEEGLFYNNYVRLKTL
jgi:hypothetical protein